MYEVLQAKRKVMTYLMFYLAAGQLLSGFYIVVFPDNSEIYHNILLPY